MSPNMGRYLGTYLQYPNNTRPLTIILGSVLEGLAKFAHVINLEFFSGLIAALQDLLASDFLQHRSPLNQLDPDLDPDFQWRS